MLSGFLHAASEGDLAGLLSLLAEDVTWYADGGGKVPAATRSPRCDECGSVRHRLGAQVSPRFHHRFVSANGQFAALVYPQGALIGVLVPYVTQGRIREFDWVLNPEKFSVGPGACGTRPRASEEGW